MRQIKGKTFLNRRESQIIRAEICERMKDIVYANADRQAAIIAEKARTGEYDLHETTVGIVVHYTIEMVVGDLLQILARHEMGKS